MAIGPYPRESGAAGATLVLEDGRTDEVSRPEELAAQAVFLGSSEQRRVGRGLRVC